jgi:hypothetical protein
LELNYYLKGEMAMMRPHFFPDVVLAIQNFLEFHFLVLMVRCMTDEAKDLNSRNFYGGVAHFCYRYFLE